MSLLAIQRGFRDHLLAGKDVPLEGVAVSAMRGLPVYRHTYRAQLVASLRDTYEKTWAWLGDEAFDRAAASHVDRHPPASWTLSVYGGNFPETLGELFPGDPEVTELAWLEWALRRAFDGPNAKPVGADALSMVSWDSACLSFLPTLVLGEVVTNAPAIWSALNRGERPPPAQRSGAAAVRVWREDLSPKYRSIEDFERRALLLALAGKRFSDLCDHLAGGDDHEVAAQRIGALLASWIQDGVVIGVGP
jgi:Putative DNA-binding domain